MLNTTINHITQDTAINTPIAGIIQKSNPKSFMVRAQIGSVIGKKLESDNPRYNCNLGRNGGFDNHKEVAILQILLMNDNYIMYELVETKHL